MVPEAETAVRHYGMQSSELQTPKEFAMRCFLPLLVACAVSGCARPDYAERWPASFELSAGPQPGYAIKKVVDKQEPALLLADDGSICRTSVERFTSSETGKWIACDWTPVYE